MTRSGLASILWRALAAALAVAALPGALVVSCAGDPPGASGGGSRAPASHAMGRWTPLAPHDTCTKEFHDTFYVIGPDGKRYPTWHAPEEVDPATGQPCRFGHDHGLDPRNSALWPDLQRHFAFDANRDGVLDSAELAASGIPFGYVSEQLEGTATPRPEEHTGYKIAFANGVARNDDLAAKSPFLRLGGGGEIDIAGGSMNYLAKATVVATSTGQEGKDLAQLKGLTVPVRLSGPFDNLRYKIEVGNMLADTAKAKVEAKVEEKKQELQQKAQDKVQEKLGEQLKGLFGR